MLLSVTLNQSDIREAIRKHIEENFSGYTPATLKFREIEMEDGREQEVEVALRRTPEGKD